MAEYLYVENATTNIVIDDAYQNYHLITKITVAGSTLPRYSAGAGGPDYYDSHGFNLTAYTFNVSNVKNPIVAYRISGDNDTYVYTVNYKEVSTNNWECRVICQRRADGKGSDGTLTLYVYGMLVSNYVPSTGAVLHVLNANGDMVFDSGKWPMKVVQFENFYGRWVAGQTPTPVIKDINGYVSSKVYAVVPCSNWFNWTNINNIEWWVSYTKMRSTDPGKLYMSSFKAGSIQAGTENNAAPYWSTDIHCCLVLDVTGI